VAAVRHLILIAYDVPGDRNRARLSTFLEEYMTRVQDSLFEGWATRAEGERLAAQAVGLAGEGASIRLYFVPRGAVSGCLAWGFPPAPRPDGVLIV